MDHSNAHLMEFTTDPITMNILHNKEPHQQSEYYKKLAEVIKNYHDVILFGPTNAKSELLNVLRADHHFEKIKLETKESDKMTQNAQHAFVRDYFSNRR